MTIQTPNLRCAALSDVGRVRSKNEDRYLLDAERQLFIVVAEVERLSRQIRNETQNEPGLSGMGATLVLALVRGRQALVVHLGDSRAYLLRHGRLEQLTRDHTLGELLVNAGKVSREDAPTVISRSTPLRIKSPSFEAFSCACFPQSSQYAQRHPQGSRGQRSENCP